MTILSILAGLAILVVGAELLVRGSAGAALRFGLTPLLIGLTIVAFGTSSPELVVSLRAALDGNTDIALGNIIGSNICNIALILGLAALIRPMKVQVSVIRKDVPILLVASVLMVLFLWDGQISFWEGGVFVVGLAAYLLFSIRMARLESGSLVEENLGEIARAKTLPLWADALFVIGGLGLLVFGADLLVDGAVAIALNLGMSQAVVGLTIVAVGTSLPELATSVVAAAKNEGDIAIGNVVGSNIFNILGILGITALVMPLSSGGITGTDLAVMMGVTLLLLPMLRSGHTVSRLEGCGLLVLFVAYTVYLLSISS